MRFKSVTQFLLVIFLSTPYISIAQQSGEYADVNPIEQLVSFWNSKYTGGNATESFPINERVLLAKANPDEEFYGIGDPNNLYSPYIRSLKDPPNKTNQAYVWGLAKSGNNLWFGTIANTLCLVLGPMLGLDNASKNPFWVCEFGESQFVPPLPPAVGDWRPPQMFVFNLSTNTIKEVTPRSDPRVNYTVGLRSAAVIDGVVLFAGPGLQGGINVFAFNAETKAYLGSKTLFQYNNIRKFLTVDGKLYTTVGSSVGGGKVLRWIGSLSDPIQFMVVGNIDAPGAELCLHKNRIYINTWPELAEGVIPSIAGIWMGPEMPVGGLNGTHTNLWQKVWSYNMYEPDLLTAYTYGGGAIASFDGKLYWGTMHVPFLATIVHERNYPAATQEQLLVDILGTFRAISIFRAEDFDDPAKSDVELLYGMPLLPAYSEEDGWKIVPNNLGAIPIYGISGFWNFFNNYTWTMSVFNDKLYVGTMDWSFLLVGGLWDIIHQMYNKYLDRSVKIDYGMEKLVEFPDYFLGADLWRFDNNLFPALPEDVSGVGNIMNYGIRSMLADDKLYLGSANPMNLAHKPNLGGWELLQLTPGSFKKETNIEQKLSLQMANYPNPFNVETTIKYTLPYEAKVKMTLYNSIGQKVKDLAQGVGSIGEHEVIWNAGDVSSGIYFSVLEVAPLSGENSSKIVTKLILLK